MFRLLKAGLLVLVCVLLSIPAQAGLARVARRYTYIDFYGGYSSPIGDYQGIGPLQITDTGERPLEVDADTLYNPTFSIGLQCGQLRNRRMSLAFGFEYSKLQVRTQDFQLDFDDPGFRQVDVTLDFNLFMLPIESHLASPYAGVGLAGGLTTVSGEGIDTQSEINFGVSLNFGAEVKLWQDPGRGFVTFASVNSYDFWATGEKPRFLNLGGAVKYYYSL